VLTTPDVRGARQSPSLWLPGFQPYPARYKVDACYTCFVPGNQSVPPAPLSALRVSAA
jgi:hypothetical protein